MKFPFIFLSLLLAATGHAETPAKAIPQTTETKAEIRPPMPDGLYIGSQQGIMPFLLVEKGQWIDPYEWVERNSLDEFNRQFVQGQNFVSFNVNTWLNTVEDITFYAKSPQILLENGQIKDGVKAQINALAPSVIASRCEAGGTDVWQCKPIYKVPKSLPRGSCRDDADSRGCGVGIIATKSAYQKLIGSSSDTGVLNISLSPTVRQIESTYKSIASNNTTQPRIRATAYSIGIFYGPAKQKLIAGSMELGYRTNLKWKPSYSGEVGPARWERLGFVWDIDRARFAYLQETAKVLNKTSDSKCAAGKLQRYCTTTSEIGIWANGEKLYSVWLHRQVVATYIPKLQAATPYDSKLLSGMRFEVVEVDLKQATSTSIFETKTFLGLN